MLTTDAAPGQMGNMDYFDACLEWAFAIGRPLNAELAIYFRDVIDVIYDGYEAKTHLQ